MKRKFLLLISLFVMALAYGQGDPIDLKGKTVTVPELGKYVTEMVPNTWYLAYQERVIISPTGYTGGYLHDNGSGKQVTKRATTEIKSGDNAEDKAAFLVRFVPTSDGEAYYMQFGTGNYAIAANTTDKSPINTTDNFYDNPLRWSLNQIGDNPGCWSVNEYVNVDNPAGRRLDNGNDSKVSFWNTGAGTELGKNYDWQLYEVGLEDASEYQIAFLQLQSRYYELVDKYDYFQPGTNPGEYDPVAVQRFQDALNNAYEVVEGGATPSLEELKAMLQELNDSYEAVKQAIVGMTIESGYYRILGPENFYVEATVDDEPQYATKGMYTEENNGTLTGKWNTVDREDCRYLWRIDLDENTGNYKLYNAATDGRMGVVTKSNNVPFDKNLDEVESEVKFEYVTTGADDNVYVAIHRADADLENVYVYVHQGGHSSGKGKSGNLLGWSVSANPSDRPTWWHLESVSDEEAHSLIDSYGPRKEHEKLVADYKAMIAKAKADVEKSKDLTNSKYITSAEQYSSPMSDEVEGKDLGALIDNNYSTYWHTDWHNVAEDAQQGDHYLQADLGEPAYELMMSLVRRTSKVRDEPTDFSLYGYETEPTDEVMKEEGTLLGHFLFGDLAEYSRPLYSDVLKFGETPYQYIRVYCEETRTGDNKIENRIYWHASELNFETPFHPAENSQYYKLGAVVTDLEALLNNPVADKDLTQADFDAMKNAYDAFLAKYVDPDPLRKLIAKVDKDTEVIAIGTDPGFWPEGSSAGALKTLVQEAKEYDASGDYTKEKTDKYIEDLNKGVDDIFSQVNPVRTDKWYQIGIPAKEVYEQYGWDLTPADEEYDGNMELTKEAVFGRVIAPGSKETQPNGAVFARQMDTDAHVGTQLFFLDPEQMTFIDESYFRFIPAGDDLYALQNGTGMYYRSRNKGGGNATLDVHPTLFKVKAIGCGENLLEVYSLEGTYFQNAHVQLLGSNCVTWNATTLGSNSGLFIHEVADVVDLPDNKYKFTVNPGQIYVMCNPVETAPVDGAFYGVRGLQKLDEDKYAVVLAPQDKAEAGEPVIYVADGTYEGESEDPVYAELTHELEINKEVLDRGGLIGTYLEIKAGKDIVVPDGKDGFTIKKASENTILHNTGYLKTDLIREVDPEEGDLVVEIDGGGVITSIEDLNGALTKVAQNGVVYNMAGQVVMKNGNINSLRNLPAGIYIINGVKVITK